MGTIVRAGTARGVVVATGPRTAFGRIARDLGERPPESAFQLGLRDFSKLLVRITVALAVSIFLINALLGRSLLEAALFALAIAVGLTPQLLPAIVTISLSTGARRLARNKVIVKRLVAIEDLGNIQATPAVVPISTNECPESKPGAPTRVRQLGIVLFIAVLRTHWIVRTGPAIAAAALSLLPLIAPGIGLLALLGIVVLIADLCIQRAHQLKMAATRLILTNEADEAASMPCTHATVLAGGGPSHQRPRV
jgi:hypothetical protein